MENGGGRGVMQADNITKEWPIDVAKLFNLHSKFVTFRPWNSLLADYLIVKENGARVEWWSIVASLSVSLKNKWEWEDWMSGWMADKYEMW